MGIDGHSISLGIWSGYLPQLRVPGVVKFSFKIKPNTCVNYRVSLDDNAQGIDALMPPNFSNETLEVAFHTLSA